MIKKLKVLNIIFNNEVRFSELPLFRGAIINKLDDREINYLFHNHIGDNYRYSYPLIQYKVINKKAALLCIDDGTEQIHSYFNNNDHILRIGERRENFVINKLKINRFTMQLWDKWFNYSLINWLALNPENHKKYKKINSIIEQEQFLENILKANIISFAKGVSWSIENEIQVKINNIDKERLMHYKKLPRLAFNINFKTNIFLPNFIGLGKGAGLGFGTVKQIYEQGK